MCDDRITPTLEDVLAAVIGGAEACGLPGWCRVGIVGGSAAWDTCCDCANGSGQLWVRLISWDIDPDFEQPGARGCDQSTRLVIGIGSLRCVPTLDDQGEPPDPEDEQAAASLIHWDADVIRNIIMCNLEERFWQGWIALDWQGGCGGGEHIFSIPFYPCDCSHSDESE